MKKLQKRAETPLAKQLAELLKEEIRGFEINSRFYTDKELIRKHNLSQPVIRAALAELVDEGYIKRIISKGTFVVSHTSTKKKLRKFRIGVFCPLGSFPQMTSTKAIQEELENEHSIILKNNYRQEFKVTELSDEFDGVIWLASRSRMYSNITPELKKIARKIVFTNCLFMDNSISCIVRDDQAAVRQLVLDLINKGFRKFGYFGRSGEFLFSQKRYDGFIEALTIHNLTIKKEWIVASNDTEYRDGIECVKKLTSSGAPLPEVLICVTDNVAMGAIVALKENGVQTPEDIMVTGFDNTEMSRQFYPSITTVNHNYESIGRFAAKSLIDQLTGKIDNGFKYYSPCEIIYRDSTNKESAVENV